MAGVIRIEERGVQRRDGFLEFRLRFEGFERLSICGRKVQGEQECSKVSDHGASKLRSTQEGCREFQQRDEDKCKPKVFFSAGSASLREILLQAASRCESLPETGATLTAFAIPKNLRIRIWIQEASNSYQAS